MPPFAAISFTTGTGLTQLASGALSTVRRQTGGALTATFFRGLFYVDIIVSGVCINDVVGSVMGLLMAFELYAIFGCKNGSGGWGRDGTEDGLQCGVFLLAALAIVVLDVLGFLFRNIDAVAVVPLLASVAAAVTSKRNVNANRPTCMFTYIIKRELSEERHRQYVSPSCFIIVAILLWRSGRSNCRAIFAICPPSADCKRKKLYSATATTISESISRYEKSPLHPMLGVV